MKKTLIKHLSSTPPFGGVRVARSLVFCVMFCRSFFFVLLSFFFWPLCCLSFYLLAIVLSVLRLTDSDCSFGIFKLFLSVTNNHLLVFVIVWLTITICEKVQLENKRLIPAKYMHNETLNKINVIDNMYHNITRESSEIMFISF